MGSCAQVQSERKSPEKYVFSKGTRAQADKIFLSQEFNKVSHFPNLFHLVEDAYIIKSCWSKLIRMHSKVRCYHWKYQAYTSEKLLQQKHNNYSILRTSSIKFSNYTELLYGSSLLKEEKPKRIYGEA